MTDHIHGEGSYVKCDWFNVVSVVTYDDHDDGLPEKFHLDHDCYCGADATHYARVGFHTETERDAMLNRIDTQTFKAHRCDEHGFEEK
jgi:hypothetical protein